MNKREERDRRGNVTKFTYNARNLLVMTLLPPSYLEEDAIRIKYDYNGNKSEEEDPNDNRVTYQYDFLNRMIQKTEAAGAILGLTTQYKYDAVGNRIEIVDAENRLVNKSTKYEYDDLNRLKTVTDADTQTTNYTYDTLGNKICVEDARKKKTWYYYDELNRLVKVRNPLRKETSYGYDAVGNRTWQLDAKTHKIDYEYDNLNRLTSRTFVGSGGYIVSYGYDPQGNRTSMTDTRENVAYEYDELNRLTDVTYGGDKTIHYDYDENGNRRFMTDAEEEETEYTYDVLNRVETIVSMDGTTAYDYDVGSRLTQMMYPNDTWTEYGYDAANRITSMVTKKTGGNVIQSITYPLYDRVGNKKQMVDSSGTTSYTYDALFRLTSVYTSSDQKTETYAYDAVGNRTTKTKTGEPTETYGYNEANQLLTRTVGGSGTAEREIEVTGAVSDTSNPPFSGVETVTVNGVEAEVEGGSYTAEGVVLHSGSNVLTATVKDKAGNESQSSITVTYNPNVPTEYKYTYDNNGNMSQMVKRVGEQSETTTYEYDYENRMTKVTLPNTTTNEFVYDGDLRRISSKNAAGTVTKFLYDGLNNLKDYASDGETVLASYTQGIGIDKLISRTDTTGARYYHADALGSTRLMTDGDQDTSATYTYDAWGKLTAHTGESTNKFKFTAREFEDEIGLQYNRARFYDPATGRFITQDPLTGGPDDPNVSYANNLYAFVQAALTQWFKAQDPARNNNRYVYCSNNPINLIDPLGLETYFFNGIRYTSDADPSGGYSDDVASVAAGEGIQDFQTIPVYDQGGDFADMALDLPREYAGGGRYTDSAYTRISGNIGQGALYDNIPAGKTREDLNLWGFSGGGAVAVNSALKLNRAGYHVDNVVLINAVCKDKFVDALKAQGTNVTPFNSQGDLLRQYKGSMDTAVREIGRALSGKESMFGDKSRKAHSSWFTGNGKVSSLQIKRTIQQIKTDMAKSQRIDQLKGKKVFGDQRNSDYKWAAQRNEEYKWADERNRDQGWGR